MRMKNINSLLVVALAFTLGACEYSNDFTGTYNNVPANLSAYSKNVNKYCVALSLESNGTTKTNFISAQDVFDANDLFASKNFNSKGTECAANQTEYLVGTRTAKVLGTSEVAESRSVGAYDCQTVVYKQYTYQESISFDLKTIADDQAVGSFAGTGVVATNVDRDHVLRYGPIYQCQPRPMPYPRRGYPYPYPYPNRGYPHPYPHGGFGGCHSYRC
jgi:hypothetical protein